MSSLSPDRVDAYLARLGTPDVRLGAVGLARLQAAHLMAVPFHNLLLLANNGRPWGLQSLHAVVDEAITGVGGNCDRTTPPFTALLQAVGFDARLAVATVREPGDHFVCVVHVDGRRFLCDVGNGHPYLRPWDLDGLVQEQAFHGWRFQFDPRGAEGPTLRRALPDGRVKTVYVVDPAPRAYADFAPMVSAHYTREEFGPFLTGLRAVRICPDAVLTLRDAEYGRDTPFGRSLRRVGGRDAARALLTERFALPAQLVDDALGVIARRRPELFSEPQWFALGRGLVGDHEDVQAPFRGEVPDVLVALATVGRPASVSRLLSTLSEEVRASGYPGRVCVFIVENHARDRGVPEPSPAGIEVHRVHIDELRPALERATDAGVLPPLGDRLPVPIGAAREAQLAVLRGHFAEPLGGLPHPSDGPLVVWMVDDDVAFQQLGPDGRVNRHTNLMYRAARFWSELPHRAVVLGTFTGDPPIPGLDGLGGQLHDLSVSVSQMLRLGPDEAWQPATAPPPTFDAYYDLTEAKVPGPPATWPYAPERAGARVSSVALSLLRDFPRLLDGQQLTRPLVWDGAEVNPRSSLRRGGNTLFLDLDALFRWPTPVHASEDGVMTRRADTLWAALAQVDDPGVVVEATLPLLHGREGQAPRTRKASTDQEAQKTAAQVRGVVLARAVAEGRDVARELAAREARVRAHRSDLRARLGVLRQRLLELGTWAIPTIDAALVEALDVLDQLDGLTRAGEPMPGNPLELEAFLARLPEAVQAWRGGW